jgi:hypothetical protein
MDLTKKQRQTILNKIDDMFMGLKARLLGRFFKGPRIYFQIVKQSDPMETLEGLYRHTMAHMFGPNAKINDENVEDLSEITANYIDAHKLKMANKIMAEVSQAKTSEEALNAIKSNMEKADDYISMLVSNEAKTVQSYAEREGIIQVASSIGVKDPIVAKLGVIDEKMCKNCKDLWHSKNLRIPKVYKLSELTNGYNTDHKNPVPTVGPTHPNCRHTMTLIPPDYGFNDAGQVVFKSLGYNEYFNQNKK